MNKLVLAVLAGIMLCPVISFGLPVYWGKVVSVDGGDTLIVRPNGSDQLIRIGLYGIGTPETGQPLATEARRYVSSALDNREIAVDIRDSNLDDRGRLPAVVYYTEDYNGTAQGIRNLNEQMVRAGMAFWQEATAPDEISFQEAQIEAGKKGLGVWAITDMEKPWDFREKQSIGKTTAAETQTSALISKPESQSPEAEAQWYVVQDSVGRVLVLRQTDLPRIVGGPFPNEQAAQQAGMSALRQPAGTTGSQAAERWYIFQDAQGKCEIVRSSGPFETIDAARSTAGGFCLK